MIRVELSAAEIPIEPGATAQLTVALTNNQVQADHIALELEGIDVEWYALPVPSLHLEPGADGSTRVIFKIGRSSECHAGTYPFIVRARSMETGESGIQQASLIVRPFSSLQIEINPKRSASTYFRPSDMREVTVSNLGNRPETLDLFASDPEDACGYEFGSDRISVKPGHAETVPLTIEPLVRPVLGSTRLYGFTVTARSTTDSFVSDNASGQLERKALLSAVMASLSVVIVLAAIGWALFRPHPVMIRRFDATPMQVTAGDKVTLSWDVANLGEGSFIAPGNFPVKSGTDKLDVQPTETTTYELTARGYGADEKRTVVVTVMPKGVVPSPAILEFKASQKRIHQGDTVTLSWKLTNAAFIVLNPLGPEKLDPNLVTSRDVSPQQTTTYELSVAGPGGDVVKKSFTVTVVDPGASAAEILLFKAKPETIEAGQKATLTWAVENGTAIDIDNGIGGNLKPKDRFDVMPHDTTTYTLTATDNRGLRVTQSVTVTVTQPPTADGTPPVTTPPDGPAGRP